MSASARTPLARSGAARLLTLSWARSSVLYETLLVLVGFGFVAVVVTWPLAGHFDTRIAAPFPGNDQLGYQFDFWWVSEHGVPFLRDYVQHEVGAPFGRPGSALANLTLLGILAPAALLSSVFDTVVAYNVLTLAGVALSGASMYLLVRWLRLGRGPAVWAGLAYAIFPYHLFATASFVVVTQYAAFPLVLMALIHWTTNPGRGSGLAVIGAIGLSWLLSPYFGVMASVMGAVALVVALVRQGRAEGWRLAATRLAALVGGLAVAILGPILVVLLVNSGGATSSLQRSPQELITLGDRLSDYWLPDRNSELMKGIVGDQWYLQGSPGFERLAFLGWVVIAAALAGLVLGFRARKRLSPSLRALFYAAPPLIIVLVLCSLRSPYPIGGLDVPMPSRLVFEIAPYVRAVGRFSIAVMAVVVALGALGLHLLTRRREQVGRIAVLAGAIVLTGAEFGFGAPVPTVIPSLVEGVSGRQLPAQAWLRDHPGGIVYNLPGPGNSALERYYMLGPRWNGHRTLNVISSPGDPAGDFISEVAEPYSPDTATLLATAGVRYVLLNGWAYRLAGLPVPKGLPARGYRREARFADGSSIYRVTAAPADGIALFKDGFDVARIEVRKGLALNWRWMGGTGRVELRVPRQGTYRASFRAAQWQRTYRVVATSPDGFESGATVDRERTVGLTLHLPAGTSRVTLRTEPTPTPAGQPSMQMGPWRLRRVGP